MGKFGSVLLGAMLMLACASTNEKINKKTDVVEPADIEEKNMQPSMPEETKIEWRLNIVRNAIKEKKYSELENIYSKNAKLIDRSGTEYLGIKNIINYWSGSKLELVNVKIDDIEVFNGIAYAYGSCEVNDGGVVERQKYYNFLNVWEYDETNETWNILLDYRQ